MTHEDIETQHRGRLELAKSQGTPEAIRAAKGKKGSFLRDFKGGTDYPGLCLNFQPPGP